MVVQKISLVLMLNVENVLVFQNVGILHSEKVPHKPPHNFSYDETWE